MNETNHKKTIDRFAKKVFISKSDIAVLKAASNFTDSINAEWEYYYYHFYYDINIVGNFIQLKRVDENTNKSSDSINNCGNRGFFSHPIDEFAHFVSSKFKEKEFFSTFINERPKSSQIDLSDIGNQSDNVAFLHAMGAAGESESTSRQKFVEHLKNCFSEYLFIEQPKRALFMLGIALHGIMDSFTPSHMGFQKYSDQDWGLHAQGDVIPFRDDEVKDYRAKKGQTVFFDPGQFALGTTGEQFLASTKKGYNSNNHINDKEFEMFRIFAEIGSLTDDVDIQAILNKGKDLSEAIAYNPKRDSQNVYEPRSLRKLNEILINKTFPDAAFIYSDTAINTCAQVYEYLTKEKNNVYDDYKDKEKRKTVIDNALNIWRNNYDDKDLKMVRNHHLNQCFYKKGSSFMEKFGNYLIERDQNNPFGGNNKI